MIPVPATVEPRLDAAFVVDAAARDAAADVVDSAVADAPRAEDATPAVGQDATQGDVVTEGAPPQRRVYIDRQVVGETPSTFRVRCGWHEVQIGSVGMPQKLEVPCGGQVRVKVMWR